MEEKKIYTGSKLHIKVGEKRRSFDLGTEFTEEELIQVTNNCFKPAEEFEKLPANALMWFTSGYKNFE